MSRVKKEQPVIQEPKPERGKPCKEQLFKDYLKSLRLRYPGMCRIYVSMHNIYKDHDHIFYGTWIDDPKIDKYGNYTIYKLEQMHDIRCVWFKDYYDPLGIESMELKRAREVKPQDVEDVKLSYYMRKKLERERAENNNRP